MDKQLLAWLAFGVYAVATAGLALRGMRRTKDLAGFALGNRDLGPLTVGITLAASVASTATFVINPGFVYTHGVSALMHLGFASFSGVILGLVLLSTGFRRLGLEGRALTLPHWIGARYRHPGMRTYFGLLNLVLAITFVVLIVKGSAVVMQYTLGLGYVASLVVIVGFVFSYILMGGTYAHVYTNLVQGGLMIVVALLIVASGFHLFGDGLVAFGDRLAAQDPNLLALTNPESALYGSVWEVYVCGFVVGFGLVAQPHILTKSLYLKSDRDLGRFLGVSALVYLIYTLVLLAGLYARVLYPEIAAQDTVMAHYLAQAFTPMVGVLISTALLAAGMSTLDGILVSASTIAANDLFLGAFGARYLRGKSEEERQRLALSASRWILVVMGVGAFLLALDPPQLVGLFAQVGIYGLVSASLAPITFGIFFRNVDARHVFAAAVAGPLVHFAYYGAVVFGAGRTLNPATSATAGILTSFAVLGLSTYLLRAKSSTPAPLEVEAGLPQASQRSSR